MEQPKAAVLIVHGLAEHLGRYEYVVSKLNSFGYSVYRFDNRGHGKSGGEKGTVFPLISQIDGVFSVSNQQKAKNFSGRFQN